MEYRVGSEGWTEAAKAGLPLFCDVSARWDPEANVFVAESEDFLPAFACVAESPTWEGLGKELDAESLPGGDRKSTRLNSSH